MWFVALTTILKKMFASDNPVKRYTAKIVMQKKVEVRLFEEIQLKDFNGMLNMHEVYANEKLPKHYPPSHETIKKVGDQFLGFIDDNRIYMNSSLLNNLEEFESTLVHEVNHFLNKQHPANDGSKEGRFQDELRAFYSEGLAKDKPITRQFLKEKAKFINQSYHLPTYLEYDLILMPHILPNKEPVSGEIYLEKRGKQLYYMTLGPKGDTVDGLLAIHLEKCTQRAINRIKDKILKETAKRGHTFPQKVTFPEGEYYPIPLELR